MLGREVRDDVGAQRVADEHRPLGAQVVEQRQQIGGVGRLAEGAGQVAALATPAQVRRDEPDAVTQLTRNAEPVVAIAGDPVRGDDQRRVVRHRAKLVRHQRAASDRDVVAGDNHGGTVQRRPPSRGRFVRR